MPRTRKYDGVVYRRAGTQIWWIRYRDRKGIARRESSQTADWEEANKKLRERLLARDANLLEVVRKGETLTYGQWSDSFLENYSKPPMRAEGTHQANERCIKHLKAAFGATRLVDVTADSIDMYLRERLRAPRRRQDEARLQGTANRQIHNGTPGVQSSPAYAECGGSQEAPSCKSLFRC